MTTQSPWQTFSLSIMSYLHFHRDVDGRGGLLLIPISPLSRVVLKIFLYCLLVAQLIVIFFSVSFSSYLLSLVLQIFSFQIVQFFSFLSIILLAVSRPLLIRNFLLTVPELRRNIKVVAGLCYVGTDQRKGKTIPGFSEVLCI